MDNINLDTLNNFETKFTATEFLEQIHIYLSTGLNDSPSYTVTELSYDPIYDECLPHSTATHMWAIDFFAVNDDGSRLNNYINIESQYIQPQYQILVSFLKISFSDDDINVVEFTNNSNVKRCYFCDYKIFSMKYFIKKEEIKVKIRYAEREPLLLLVSGSTGNYTNETKISKKQRVLQDEFYQREVSLFLDYIEHPFPEFLL